MTRVLVIDDDVLVGALLREHLSNEGFTVEHVTLGEHGISSAKTSRPDLIFLDVNLPDATGFQICGRLRQLPQTKTTPIIMMTGAARSNSQQSIGRQMGANDYVLKPFDIDELTNKVHALLGTNPLDPALKPKNAAPKAKAAETAPAEEKPAPAKSVPPNPKADAPSSAAPKPAPQAKPEPSPEPLISAYGFDSSTPHFSNTYEVASNAVAALQEELPASPVSNLVSDHPVGATEKQKDARLPATDLKVMPADAPPKVTGSAFHIVPFFSPDDDWTPDDEVPPPSPVSTVAVPEPVAPPKPAQEKPVIVVNEATAVEIAPKPIVFETDWPMDPDPDLVTKSKNDAPEPLATAESAAVIEHPSLRPKSHSEEHPEPTALVSEKNHDVPVWQPDLVTEATAEPTPEPIAEPEPKPEPVAEKIPEPVQEAEALPIWTPDALVIKEEPVADPEPFVATEELKPVHDPEPPQTWERDDSPEAKPEIKQDVTPGQTSVTVRSDALPAWDPPKVLPPITPRPAAEPFHAPVAAEATRGFSAPVPSRDIDEHLEIPAGPIGSFIRDRYRVGLSVIALHVALVVTAELLAQGSVAELIRGLSLAVGGWALLLGLMTGCAALMRLSLTGRGAIEVLGRAAIPIAIKAALGLFHEKAAMPDFQELMGNTSVIPASTFWLRPLDLFQVAALIIIGLALARQPGGTPRKSILTVGLLAVFWAFFGRGYFRPF